MRIRWVFLLGMLSSLLLARGEEVVNVKNVGVASFVGSVSTALSQADVALSRSCIVANHIKGDFGESVAGKAILKAFLEKEGRWSAITPRSGRQGLDHLFIKTYKSGKISQILVGESKYNTSALGMTADGLQGTRPYVMKRLSVLADRYGQLDQTKTFLLKKPPLNPNRELCIRLPSGKNVYFWREKAGGDWFFSGTRDELAKARELIPNYAKTFRDAANGSGRIAKFRSRVFHIAPKGNNIEINIYDGTKIPNGNIKAATPVNNKPILIKGALLDKNSTPVRELAAVIKRKMKLDDSEALAYAKKLQQSHTPKAMMTKYSLPKALLRNSAIATGSAVILDATVQFALNGEVKFAPLGLTAGSVFVGTLAGQGVNIALTKPYARPFIRRISGPLRCSAPTVASFASSVASGVVVSALVSYGSYFLGWSDLKEANRGMIIGTSASIAGAGTAAGAMALVAAYGTASTGTAISSLGGAAAANATVAWFGGGSVAAGGGGVAVGSAVLTAGAAVVAIAIAAAGTYAFVLYDKHKETEQIAMKLDWFLDDSFLQEILQRECDRR